MISTDTEKVKSTFISEGISLLLKGEKDYLFKTFTKQYISQLKKRKKHLFFIRGISEVFITTSVQLLFFLRF